jgi:hypothetical protein
MVVHISTLFVWKTKQSCELKRNPKVLLPPKTELHYQV